MDTRTTPAPVPIPDPERHPSGPLRVRWSLPGPLSLALLRRAMREDRNMEAEAMRVLRAELVRSGDLDPEPKPADR